MKKIISVVLSCWLMLSLSACGSNVAESTNVKDVEATAVNKTVTEEKRSNVTETDEQTGEDYYLLADFENYYECTQVKYSGGAKMEQVKKSEYPELVTYGEQSLKVNISPGEKPLTMRIATDSSFFNETSDFSNLNRVSFDIYNSQSEKRIIRFYVNRFLRSSPDEGTYNAKFEDIWNDDNQRKTSFKLELEPEKWTHIVVTADDFANNNVSDLSQVDAFVIAFEGNDTYDTEQVFYVDNVRAYMNAVQE